MINKKKPFNIKSFVIATLRRASYRYAPREEARRAMRVGRNQYTCQSCKGVFGRKDTKLDHINPVIDPVKGWISFDSFIERLFCEVEGFQVLCNPCHDKKTHEEGILRRASKLIDKNSK